MDGLKEKLKNFLINEESSDICVFFENLQEEELNYLMATHNLDKTLTIKEICIKLSDILLDKSKQRLPNEIMDKIFSFSAKEDIKKWRSSVSQFIYKRKAYADIFEAIDDKNLEAVEHFIKNSDELDIQKLLIYSTVKGSLTIIKYLLSIDTDFKFLSKIILPLSVKYKHFDIVKYLVELGIEIHDDALINSVSQNNTRMTKYLIENGADIHADDDYPIIGVSKAGNLEMLKYIVDNGGDINAQYGSPLKVSAENGHLDVVKYLVDLGVDIHVDDDYALRYSAENGHLDVVKYLMKIN